MKVSELIMVLEEHRDVFGDNKVRVIDENAEEYKKIDVEEFNNAIVLIVSK